MQRRLCISVLLAAGLAAGLAWTPAAAHAAADPYTLTNGFYVNPNNSAEVWANANPSDGRAVAIKSNIGAKPAATWFTGSNSTPIGTLTGAVVGAAAYSDKLPVLVAYDITDRDICAGQSSGGAASDAAYDTWIAGFAGGTGDGTTAGQFVPQIAYDLVYGY
jgi:endoglucanase